MKWLQTETVNFRVLVPSGLTAAGLVGGVVGYVVALKTLEKKYKEIADKEIAEAKVFYQGMYSRPTLVAVSEEEEPEKGLPFDDLPGREKERQVQEAVQALRSYQAPDGDPRPDPTPVPTVVNIFNQETPPGEEVLEALLADRDPEEPYVITKQEFLDNDPEHEQMAFTYFEGDGVLVNDKDEYNPINDVEKVAGEDNLMRFGYGSGDDFVVYIRNETVDPPFDLHVTRSTGKYAEEVMGFDQTGPHLEHSQKIRKFRLDDD